MSIDDAYKVIDKYYWQQPDLREILLRHSSQVAEMALEIVDSHHLPLDKEQVAVAAMLHDIGIVKTDAASIGCYGTQPYLMHGVIGAKILADEGFDQTIAEVAAHHTGAGITREDIISQGLPLPIDDYCPRNLLEKLICYADKFYSKTGNMQRKSLEKIRSGMAAHGESSLRRFDELHKIFC